MGLWSRSTVVFFAQTSRAALNVILTINCGNTRARKNSLIAGNEMAKDFVRTKAQQQRGQVRPLRCENHWAALFDSRAKQGLRRLGAHHARRDCGQTSQQVSWQVQSEQAARQSIYNSTLQAHEAQHDEWKRDTPAARILAAQLRPF